MSRVVTIRPKAHRAVQTDKLNDTIVCWEGLLNWSERRVISNQFLDDIRALKDVLEELGT